MMWKKIFLLPAQNLVTTIPIVLVLGFIIGNLVDTGFLSQYILVMTIFMIYPTMIGMPLRETFSREHGKVLLIAHILNFIIIPLLAYSIGLIFLGDNPRFIAGLVLASLLPTSGMTISWTALFQGNVSTAIKLTVTGLILGSLLTPWYLFILVDQLVPVDLWATFKTIITVVFLPLLAGNLTYRWLLKRLSKEDFQKKIKPLLPAFSVWAMLAIIFVSISMKAKIMIAHPQLLLTSLLALLIFYLSNFLISTIIARTFFTPKDGVALIYGTVMRNLSLALGLAVTNFGAESALLVTLAFIIQVQGAAWFGSLSCRYQWLGAS